MDLIDPKILGGIEAKTDAIDVGAIISEAYIDPEAELPPQPIALSLGTYTYQDRVYYIPWGSYGDISAIVGPSKSMKSFLTALLKAGYIGGRAIEHHPDLKGHDTDGKLVIQIDTEQSPFHVQAGAQRVIQMVGATPSGFRTYALRRYTVAERLAVVEEIVKRYAGRLGLLVIDQVADLVTDVNDLAQCNELSDKLLRWSTDSGAHIITVIHRNKESNHATGHLGSALTKKCETVAMLNRTEYETIVEPQFTRNYPWREFKFSLDTNHLPHFGGYTKPF